MFTQKEDDGTLIRLIVYIDDCLYFSTSDTAKEKFQKHFLTDSMWNYKDYHTGTYQQESTKTRTSI
jgi:hypothetical protein